MEKYEKTLFIKNHNLKTKNHICLIKNQIYQKKLYILLKIKFTKNKNHNLLKKLYILLKIKFIKNYIFKKCF